jgi:hypothetical protein
MSGSSRDWFKFRKKLASDPRTFRIASRLRNAGVTQDALHELAALGALAKFWGFADTHISDDDTLNLSADEINKVVGVANFCDFLPPDWLKILDSERVHLPDFLEHNGTSAKVRAMGQIRQQRYRHARNDTVTRVSRKSDAGVTRKASPEENRIDIRKETPLPPVIGLNAEAWAAWASYRKAIRKPLKPASQELAQLELARFGADQMAVVNRSIAAGWTGLFELKNLSGRAPQAPAAQPAQRDSAEWAELLAAASAEGMSKPYTNERVREYAERLQRWRNRSAPKIDTSAITQKLRGVST